jgi:hypothetical protein
MNGPMEPAFAGAKELFLPEKFKRPRLRRKIAAEYLELRWGITIAPTTLAKYACVGGGPDFQRMNRTPLYSLVGLDAWARQKLGPTICNTSQVTE